MKNSTYVCKLSPNEARQLERALKEKGSEFTRPVHTQFQVKQKDVQITLYESMKLLLQGKGTEEFVRYFLEPQILKKVTLGYEGDLAQEKGRDTIGTDECGKGDYFGPLVVAAVYIPKNKMKEAVDEGITDSKKISDKKIKVFSPWLKKQFAFQTVIIGPGRYNELYSKIKNLNDLLAWAHASAIKSLFETTRCTYVMVDKFANEKCLIKALGSELIKKIDLNQKPRAEVEVSVAAASIIARATFLEQIKKLEEKIHETLPLGAGEAVDQKAKEIFEQKGMNVLEDIAKIHFKTTQKIIN